MVQSFPINHFVESQLKVVAGLEDQVTTEKQSATFQCQLSKPKCNIKWYKNGKELKPNDKHQLLVEGDKYKITIMNCTTDDPGKYTLKCGGVESSAQLTVKSKQIPQTTALLARDIVMGDFLFLLAKTCT